MKFLRLAWQDIKRGENIDLYVAVILAISLAILATLNISLAQNLIAPITLLVLSLLAISHLSNRHALEELSHKVSESSNTLFLEEFPARLKDDFRQGSQILLIGVSLNNTVDEYYSTIEQKLSSSKATFRILLVDPTSTACEIAASRSYARPEIERIRRRIYDTLGLLCDLQKIAPDRMEIHLTQYPLAFGAVGINMETSGGMIYLDHYPFRTEGGSLPKFVMQSKDGRWYHLFKQELNNLWESSSIWNCENKDANPLISK